MTDRRVTERVIGAAIEVHRELGPGLLESAYQAGMVYELGRRGIGFERQRQIPVNYKGVRLDCGYRVDLLVEGEVIVELKAIDALHPIHTAQVLSYLKLAGLQVGLLINFNVLLLKDGIRRVVLGLARVGEPAGGSAVPG
jgi:GxxExxY protein